MKRWLPAPPAASLKNVDNAIPHTGTHDITQLQDIIMREVHLIVTERHEQLREEREARRLQEREQARTQREQERLDKEVNLLRHWWDADNELDGYEDMEEFQREVDELMNNAHANEDAEIISEDESESDSDSDVADSGPHDPPSNENQNRPGKRARPYSDRRSAARWRISRWLYVIARVRATRGRQIFGNKKTVGKAAWRILNMELTPSERVRLICECGERALCKWQRKLEDTPQEGDWVARLMHQATGERTGGGLKSKVFEILNKANGRNQQRGDKLAAMCALDDNGKPTGEVWRSPEDVLHNAHVYGEWIHRPTQPSMPTVLKVLDWLGPGNLTTDAQNDNECLQRACEYNNFEHALSKCDRDKGVGCDGFNAYVLRRLSKRIREMYHSELVKMMHSCEFPAAYKVWIAMLAMKGADEEPNDLARRRDLWVVPHGQKIIMRMLNPEYERAAMNSVSLTQAGYAIDRMPPEQVLTLRIAIEQAMIDSTTLCIGFIDLANFFMSCCREVQWAVEKWTDVAPSITRIVQALHDAVHGRYETEWGLTSPFDILTGTGQGCVNGAVRSKLQLIVMQRAIHKLCQGVTIRQLGVPSFVSPRSTTPSPVKTTPSSQAVSALTAALLVIPL